MAMREAARWCLFFSFERERDITAAHNSRTLHRVSKLAFPCGRRVKKDSAKMRRRRDRSYVSAVVRLLGAILSDRAAQ